MINNGLVQKSFRSLAVQKGNVVKVLTSSQTGSIKIISAILFLWIACYYDVCISVHVGRVSRHGVVGGRYCAGVLSGIRIFKSYVQGPGLDGSGEYGVFGGARRVDTTCFDWGNGCV